MGVLKRKSSQYFHANLKTAQNPEIKIKSEPTFYTKDGTSEKDEEYENIDTEDNDE